MFLGKPTLRGVDEKYEFTNDILEEYFKCAEDIIYFAQKFFYIVNIDDGKHLIQLYDFQKKALKVFTSNSVNGRKNTIVLMSRQMGKCVTGDTHLTIRNRKTGEIKDICVSEFFDNFDVSESDYNKDKDTVIRECLEFLES